MARKKSNLLSLLSNFDEDRKYYVEEIKGAIELLPEEVITKVQAVYGVNYDEVISDVDPQISKYVATSVIPKLKKILKESAPMKKVMVASSTDSKDSKPEVVRHTILKRTKKYTDPNVEPVQGLLTLDPMQVIKEVIKTKTLSEVEDYLSQEEAILLILRLGTSKLGTYTPAMLAKMFNMTEEEVDAMLAAASERYLDYFESLRTSNGYQKVNK